MWLSTGVCTVFIQCVTWGGDRGSQTDKHLPPSRVPLPVNFKKSRHLGFGVFIDIWSMLQSLVCIFLWTFRPAGAGWPTRSRERAHPLTQVHRGERQGDRQSGAHLLITMRSSVRCPPIINNEIVSQVPSYYYQWDRQSDAHLLLTMRSSVRSPPIIINEIVSQMPTYS